MEVPAARSDEATVFSTENTMSEENIIAKQEPLSELVVKLENEGKRANVNENSEREIVVHEKVVASVNDNENREALVSETGNDVVRKRRKGRKITAEDIDRMLHLQAVVKLNNGDEGYVFTYEDPEDPSAGFNCHVCQIVIQSVNISNHFKSKRHTRNLANNSFLCENFTKFKRNVKDIVIDAVSGKSGETPTDGDTSTKLSPAVKTFEEKVKEMLELVVMLHNGDYGYIFTENENAEDKLKGRYRCHVCKCAIKNQTSLIWHFNSKEHSKKFQSSFFHRKHFKKCEEKDIKLIIERKIEKKPKPKSLNKVEELSKTIVKLDNGEKGYAFTYDIGPVNPKGRYTCHVCLISVCSADAILDHSKARRHGRKLAAGVFPSANFTKFVSNEANNSRDGDVVSSNSQPLADESLLLMVIKDRESKEVLEQTVKLDNGKEGYIISKCFRQTKVLYKCNVCGIFIQSLLSTAGHFTGKRHVKNIQTHEFFPSKNFKKFKEKLGLDSNTEIGVVAPGTSLTDLAAGEPAPQEEIISQEIYDLPDIGDDLEKPEEKLAPQSTDEFAAKQIDDLPEIVVDLEKSEENLTGKSTEEIIIKQIDELPEFALNLDQCEESLARPHLEEIVAQQIDELPEFVVNHDESKESISEKAPTSEEILGEAIDELPEFVVSLDKNEEKAIGKEQDEIIAQQIDELPEFAGELGKNEESATGKAQEEVIAQQIDELPEFVVIIDKSEKDMSQTASTSEEIIAEQIEELPEFVVTPCNNEEILTGLKNNETDKKLAPLMGVTVARPDFQVDIPLTEPLLPAQSVNTEIRELLESVVKLDNGEEGYVFTIVAFQRYFCHICRCPAYKPDGLLIHANSRKHATKLCSYIFPHHKFTKFKKKENTDVAGTDSEAGKKVDGPLTEHEKQVDALLKLVVKLDNDEEGYVFTSIETDYPIPKVRYICHICSQTVDDIIEHANDKEHVNKYAKGVFKSRNFTQYKTKTNQVIDPDIEKRVATLQKLVSKDLKELADIPQERTRESSAISRQRRRTPSSRRKRPRSRSLSRTSYRSGRAPSPKRRDSGRDRVQSSPGRRIFYVSHSRSRSPHRQQTERFLYSKHGRSFKNKSTFRRVQYLSRSRSPDRRSSGRSSKALSPNRYDSVGSYVKSHERVYTCSRISPLRRTIETHSPLVTERRLNAASPPKYSDRARSPRRASPYQRRLGSPSRSPYRRKTDRYSRDLSPKRYDRDRSPKRYDRRYSPGRTSPYRRKLGSRSRSRSPYRRNAGRYSPSPKRYARDRSPRKNSPYRRRLGSRSRSRSPYRRTSDHYSSPTRCAIRNPSEAPARTDTYSKYSPSQSAISLPVQPVSLDANAMADPSIQQYVNDLLEPSFWKQFCIPGMENLRSESGHVGVISPAQSKPWATVQPVSFNTAATSSTEQEALPVKESMETSVNDPSKLQEINSDRLFELEEFMKSSNPEIVNTETDEKANDDDFLEITPTQNPEVIRNIVREGMTSDEDFSEAPDVISVLLLLTELDKHLGSFAPRIMRLFTQAVALDRQSRDQPATLLDKEENIDLLNRVRVKLKGQLGAKMVATNMISATEKAMSAVALLLKAHEAKKKLLAAQPSSAMFSGVVDKAAIAQQIATALIAEGKTDVTEEALEELINAVVKTVQNEKQRKKENRPKVEKRGSNLQNLLSTVVKSYSTTAPIQQTGCHYLLEESGDSQLINKDTKNNSSDDDDYSYEDIAIAARQNVKAARRKKRSEKAEQMVSVPSAQTAATSGIATAPTVASPSVSSVQITFNNVASAVQPFASSSTTALVTASSTSAPPLQGQQQAGWDFQHYGYQNTYSTQSWPSVAYPADPSYSYPPYNYYPPPPPN